MNFFEIVLEKCEVQKSLSLKKYFQRRNSQTCFCFLCVNLQTVEISLGAIGQIPMSFSSLQYPLQVIKLIREIFASGQNQGSSQNLKPPFLCQHLIFFNDFFFTSEISFGSFLYLKNRNFKKIADLKVYGNLKGRSRTTDSHHCCRYNTQISFKNA